MILLGAPFVPTDCLFGALCLCSGSMEASGQYGNDKGARYYAIDAFESDPNHHWRTRSVSVLHLRACELFLLLHLLALLAAPACASACGGVVVVAAAGARSICAVAPPDSGATLLR